MSPTPCPTPEQLLLALDQDDALVLGHLADCPDCGALLEDHRQLEKDLFRLQDPLPPADLLPAVMARVAEAPVPLRRELWTFGGIAGLCSTLLLALVFTGPGGLFSPAASFAQALARAQYALVGLAQGTLSLWSIAALPMTLLLGTLLLLSLLGLRRLTGGRLSEASA